MVQRQSKAAAGNIARRLEQAINEHDLEALVGCFQPDVVSEQPAHPARNFRGREQIRRNWTQIFAGIPDLRATLVRSAVDEEVLWAEWSWQGSRPDGSAADMAGVTILGLTGDKIAWLHFYMEPVEQQGAGIDAAIQGQATGQ
jgi:ketosteroid isomerase-like protein